MFGIETFSWWVFPFLNMICPSPSCLVILVKSLFYHILELQFQLVSIACKTFLQPLNLRWFLSLSLKYVSYMQKNPGSSLRIQSVSLCLFIEGLSLFTLRDIKEMIISFCYVLFCRWH
jgi:hypothetical protein